MGFVGLHQPEDLPFSPCTEVGWRLARPYWGCGYATEAARASLSFAFGRLGLSSVVAFTAVSNTRSQGVMRRLGMTLESPFDHPRLPDDHPLRPHVLYRITHDRFAR
jgi:RimJ/RimL family protein N-acetyltransferase